MRGDVRFVVAARSEEGGGRAAGLERRQACVFARGWIGFGVLTAFSDRGGVVSTADDPISCLNTGPLNDLPADEACRLGGFHDVLIAGAMTTSS